ncbi:MAG TPA: acyl-CoA thioesterase [Brevundimonas sp.]|jgi:acyl-CoA thioesterase YciA|uniref:acyl-CoA thioesterase n=1 Tax=Brevundimonas sp. TaxID=1871086 RepID=UPI002CC24CFF|nr:acyl-CoA thioesterase [Brevundimonas sp.]HRH21432.1 acyl-CoA thioesterase [Brevundimonas sp.]
MNTDTDRIRPPDDAPQIRVIAMPADTNPNGDIFGGWLLSQMDQAAASAAYEAAQGRCVTVAVDAMVFHHPVYVGDVVSLYARVVRRGRTSVGVFVEAWRSPRERDAYEKVTEGIFTFVAIDEQKRPRVLPDA